MSRMGVAHILLSATPKQGRRDRVTVIKAKDLPGQNATVPTRELARTVTVNPSTMSRGRRSAEFKARLDRAALRDRSTR